MANRSTNSSNPKGEEPRYGSAPDLEDLVNGAVRWGSGLGATVLGSIADALEQVGDSLQSARRADAELPFPQWKRKLDRKLQNGPQGEALALAITGWVLAGCFGIAAIVMWALSAVGPQALGVTQEEFLVFPILMACFAPLTVGFGIMGGVGVRKYRYVSRLRRYLRVARDWVCDLREVARNSAASPEQARKDMIRAVAAGDLPDALLQEDGTLYLDLSRQAPQPVQPETPPAVEPAPQSEQDAFLQEGTDFLEYLRCCQGKLGGDTDEELDRMRRVCAAILGFARNHPQQQNRLRRFREYYLPTTRKLLDTAQGLGDAQVQHAREIRRDITGILHTLNEAYSKLYDTLLQEVSLDVSTEIDTLETMLRQDGLTHDFEMDFNHG